MRSTSTPAETATQGAGDALGPFVRVFLASLLAHLAAFLFVHFPGFLREHGALESTIGLAFSTSSLFAIASRPFVGRLMDRHGRRHALLVGGVLHLLATSLYLAIEGPGPFMLAVRALHGVATGFFFSAVFAVASDLAPDALRTQRLAVFGISGILPMSLGALLADLLLRQGVGHRGVFLVAAIFAGLGLALATTVPETRPTTESDASPGLLDALRAPSLVWLWVSGVLFAIALASYFAFVRNYVAIAHLGTVSTFFTPYAITAVAVRLLFGSVPARFGEANVFPPALLLVFGGLLTLVLANGPLAIGIAGTLCGLGHAFAFPTLMTLFVERSPRAIRGSVVALYTALMDVGLLVSGYGFGHVADVYGHRSVFAISACVALLSVGIFLARGRRAPPSTTVEAGTPVD